MKNKQTFRENSQESRRDTEQNLPGSGAASQPISGDFQPKSRKTLFTEFETIEIAIQIINLLEVLHQKNIIHTNLCPENIFLVNK